MNTSLRLVAAATALLVPLTLGACGDDAGSDDSGTTSTGDGTAGGDGTAFPVTIEHAYGETVIESKPERVAAVAWANHEVPLALGVVPVGMAAVSWGDDDDDGVLPWVEEKLEELGAETPTLFDETDGIDFEGVAATQPDVILASYSGLTQSDYDTLSKIAPVVAFPEIAWATSVDDMIEMNAEALGLEDEGEQLVADLDAKVDEALAGHPELDGKSVMFSFIEPTDLSQVGFYTTNDTRPGFLEDIGMTMPASVTEASEGSEEFYVTRSAENLEEFADVDIIVTYGDDALVETLRSDPVLAQIPAIANGAVVALPDSTPIAASANPSPLSIEWGIEEYLDLIGTAAQGA